GVDPDRDLRWWRWHGDDRRLPSALTALRGADGTPRRAGGQHCDGSGTAAQALIRSQSPGWWHLWWPRPSRQVQQQAPSRWSNGSDSGHDHHQPIIAVRDAHHPAGTGGARARLLRHGARPTLVAYSRADLVL